MRQARDLLYLTVHLGSNPNPGVFVVFVSEGIKVALNGRKRNRIYENKILPPRLSQKSKK